MKIKNKAKALCKTIRSFWQENTRGGVTVFVCMVLIPVLMFTGLMVDFARIKLYHSEAAVAANSYANALLGDYNEMLYDIYGLISVTQDEEAIKALDTIKAYIESAYDPRKMELTSQGTLVNMPDSLSFAPNRNISDYWSPYGNTLMRLNAVNDAKKNDITLSDPNVFANQVCDYMKVIGPVDLVWNGVVGALNKDDRVKEDSKLAKQATEVNSKYQTLSKGLQGLYEAISNVQEPEPENTNMAIKGIPYMAAERSTGTYQEEFGYAKISLTNLVRPQPNSYLYDEFLKIYEGYYDSYVIQQNEKIENSKTSEDAKKSDGDSGENNSSDNNNSGSYVVPESENKFYNEVSPKIEKMKNFNDAFGAILDYARDPGTHSYANQKLNSYKGAYPEDIAGNEYLSEFMKFAENKIQIEADYYTLDQTLDEADRRIGDIITKIGDESSNVTSAAKGANTERTKLIDMANQSSSDNDMAKEMKNEYSFADEKEHTKQMNFISNYNYDALKAEYQNNRNYIAKMREYIRQDKEAVMGAYDSLMTHMENAHIEISQQLSIYDNLDDTNLAKPADNDYKWDTYPRIDEIASCNYPSENTFNFSFDPSGQKVTYPDDVNYSKWFVITEHDGQTASYTNYNSHSTFYAILKQWYGGNDPEAQAKFEEYAGTEGDDGKKSILDQVKEAIEALSSNSPGSNIINEFNDVSVSGNAKPVDGGFDISSLFGSDGSLSNDAADDTRNAKNNGQRNIEYYMTKLLVLDYDYNFFTWATYGRKGRYNGVEDENNFKTLKGWENTPDNSVLVKEVPKSPLTDEKFLAGAELEYIFLGNDNAKKNLQDVRMQIAIIRAVENLASSYSIDEVNLAIKSVETAVAAIPFASLIVGILLRGAFAMAETYADLCVLYNGNKVALFKTDLNQLSVLRLEGVDQLKNLVKNVFGANIEPSEDKKSGSALGDINLDYTQYLLVCMTMFCSTSDLVERSKTLVEANMKKRLGEFSLSKCSVAVETTCTVDKMNLLILGGVFKDEAVNDYLSDDKITIMEDGFSYTVNRSY